MSHICFLSFCLSLSIYLFVCVCVCIYIYIYIYGERKREKQTYAPTIKISALYSGRHIFDSGHVNRFTCLIIFDTFHGSSRKING
jgi:hypothetical protein